MRGILLKDAYGIRYRNMRLSGARIMPVHVQSVADTYWGTKLGKDALDALRSLHQMKSGLISGNVLDKQSPPIKPGVTEVPFAYGPR